MIIYVRDHPQARPEGSMQYKPRSMDLIHGPCMHPCTNLDLLGIGQNVFTTARFKISIDATKKNSNPSTLELVT